jgi:capsular exopolysaccharide synthesis family protein
LAFGGVLLLEYLNDTIKTPEEVTRLLSVPVLGTIFRFGKSGDPYPKRLITYLHPNSPISENYRTLRTNLLYSSQNGAKQAYIVTSPAPEEGKSITAANLAVVMASAGLRVLLVDADLRRPRAHEIFDLKNELGLTTLLFADPTRSERDDDARTEAEFTARLRQCIQNTSVPRLRVITSGFTPSNPAEILGSALMKRWFDLFHASTNIDVVIFDTPPVLVVADSAVLAATIDVPVLLVVQAGRTRRAAALRTKAQLDTLGARLAGVSLNQMNPIEQGYGYGYGGGYYYYSNPENGTGPSRWQRFIGRFRKSG